MEYVRFCACQILNMDGELNEMALGRLLCYSKKELAIELNIPYRALLRLYNGKQSENDVVTIMSGIALYCLRERIPPDTLFHGFAPR